MLNVCFRSTLFERLSLQMVLSQQEQLSEMIKGEDKKTCMQQLHRLIVHLLAWTACLISIFLGTIGVHYLSEKKLNFNVKVHCWEKEIVAFMHSQAPL